MTNNSDVDFADAEFRNANPDESLLDSPQHGHSTMEGGSSWFCTTMATFYLNTKSEQEGATARLTNMNPHSKDVAD